MLARAATGMTNNFNNLLVILAHWSRHGQCFPIIRVGTGIIMSYAPHSLIKIIYIMISYNIQLYYFIRYLSYYVLHRRTV